MSLLVPSPLMMTDLASGFGDRNGIYCRRLVPAKESPNKTTRSAN